MTATLADATAADHAEVLELLQEAGLGAEGMPDDLHGFVVARAAGVLIGVAGIEAYGESALLRSVAVRPGQRSSGVGRRLVEAALQRASAIGARAVVLLTKDADDWFSRFGFERISRDDAPLEVRQSVQFTGACPDTAVCMKRGMPIRILVLCTGNSARSQIAEALLGTMGGPRVQVASAGTRPAAQVNPGALEVLARHGIIWEGHRPQHVDAVEPQPWDLVITVCDDAREECPFFPGAAVQVHWGQPDPAAEPEGQAGSEAFEAAFAILERRSRSALALPLESMSPAERAPALRALA